jgi:hypothetical protein
LGKTFLRQSLHRVRRHPLNEGRESKQVEKGNNELGAKEMPKGTRCAILVRDGIKFGRIRGLSAQAPR